MTKLFSSPRFLAIYSGVLTITFAVVVLAGFAESRQKQTFDEITVHRINVVEPDGTLRMTISNKAVFPGIVIKGKETPHPDRTTAGMLFFNDEGTENGGLIFGGSKDKDGKVTSYGHLSFDQYEQDQISNRRHGSSYVRAGIGRRLASCWDVLMIVPWLYG
jgi:hypothetical protein